MANSKKDINDMVDDGATKNELTTTSEDVQITMPTLEGIEGMGFEELDASDLAVKIPYAVLLQPTSEIVTKSRGAFRAGDFLITSLDGEQKTYEKLTVTIIAFTKMRSMWSPNFKRGDSPLCRSFDGKIPVQNDMGCTDCSKCPHAKWDPDKKASECRISYVLLCQDLATGALFKVQASGASYADAKDFIKKLYNTAKKHKTASFAFQVDLKSEYQSNDKGTFYTLNIDSATIKQNSKLFTGGGVEMEYFDFLKDTYNVYIDSIKLQSQKSIDDFADESGAASGDAPF